MNTVAALLVCVAVSVNSLSVTLSSSKQQFSATEDVTLLFTLRNPSDSPVQMLKNYLPGKDASAQSLTVTRDGGAVGFVGPLNKTLDLSYITLQPAEELSMNISAQEFFRLDITGAYHFCYNVSVPGLVTVGNVTLQSLVSNDLLLLVEGHNIYPPQVYGPGSNTVQIAATNCPYIAGYTAHQDLDHPGDDLGNVGTTNVFALADICNRNPRCMSFNTHGWIKSRAFDLTIHFRGQCYYVWNNWAVTSCPSVANYNTHPDADHNGNDIRNVGTTGAFNVAQYCTPDPNCNGFNTDGWIKNAILPVRFARGFCYYTWSNLAVAVTLAGAHVQNVSISVQTGAVGPLKSIEQPLPLPSQIELQSESLPQWLWITIGASVAGVVAMGLAGGFYYMRRHGRDSESSFTETLESIAMPQVAVTTTPIARDVSCA